MRISIMQDVLARALGIVSKAVDSRPTLPVLANVLLTASDAQLTLAATNLEMTITTSIGAQVDKAGTITLPAKTFTELVGNLMTGQRVTLTLDEVSQTVNIKSGMTNSNIKGISATEFPLVPPAREPDVVLNGGILRDMINQTVFAVAKDDNRPVLTGVYTQLIDNTMTMASADGFRLSVHTAPIDRKFAKERSLVIPARSISEVARIITEPDEPVGLALPDERNLIQFSIGSTFVSSQLLEGRFPDFRAIIPKRYSTASSFDKADLLRACKRAEIFARDSNHSTRLMIKPPANTSEPGEVTIIGRSSERGDNEGVIDAAVEGEAMEVAFNVRYLIDALNVLPDERVILESSGANQPGVLRPEGRDNFVYVVMPMSTGR